MSVAMFSLLLSALIWALVAGIGWSHWRHRHHTNLLGVSLIIFASIALLSTAPGPLGLQEHVDAFRFVTAGLRSAILILLLAYVAYRVDGRRAH